MKTRESLLMMRSSACPLSFSTRTGRFSFIDCGAEVIKCLCCLNSGSKVENQTFKVYNKINNMYFSFKMLRLDKKDGVEKETLKEVMNHFFK